MDNRNPRKIQDFRAEIDALGESVNGIAHGVTKLHPERSLLAFQADWHIRGMLYHLRQLFENYSMFVDEVSARARTGASVILMYAPCFQDMPFEFYGLVNLCRISLDNLRTYLRPLFTRSSDQLPKSIRDVLKGKTNCPVYTALADQAILVYLLDLRNCLVHYRSFATSDNAFVLEEGVDPSDVVGDGDSFLAAMARAYFRRVGETSISVNVYLPDRIFETDSAGNIKLATFTYEERWNLLSTARNFTYLATNPLSLALQSLLDIPEPLFEFSAGQRRA